MEIWYLKSTWNIQVEKQLKAKGQTGQLRH